MQVFTEGRLTWRQVTTYEDGGDRQIQTTDSDGDGLADSIETQERGSQQILEEDDDDADGAADQIVRYRIDGDGVYVGADVDEDADGEYDLSYEWTYEGQFTTTVLTAGTYVATSTTNGAGVLVRSEAPSTTTKSTRGRTA